MNVMKAGALLGGLVLAVAAPAAAAEVQLVADHSEVSGCERIGEVRSSSMLGGAFAQAGYNRALSKLKRQAQERGATHMQMLTSNSGFTGSNMIGIAYRCPTPATPPN